MPFACEDTAAEEAEETAEEARVEVTAPPRGCENQTLENTRKEKTADQTKESKSISGSFQSRPEAERPPGEL